MKDHEVAQLVNRLRDIAKEFHASGQLRERIAHEVVPHVNRDDPHTTSPSHLPALAEGQCWCCARGCGECHAKESLYEYSRTRYPNGTVVSKSCRIFVSACCAADLMLWDEKHNDFTDWQYAATDHRQPAPD